MIEVSHLTKRYGDFTAVDQLSFRLVPGEILGFLGPNGAGKSTTMKMLTGYLEPSSGSVSIMGCDIERDPLAAQRQLGYLPEGAPAYEEMTPLGFLRFIGQARGFEGETLEGRVAASVETMSLADVLHQPIETLSKGFKRRVGLAQAILHDPDVLILDEPTDGLDPNQKHQVREMIKGLSSEKIVIISTHILEEVTAVCNRAMVMASGRIVFDDTPAALLEKSTYHGAVSLRMRQGSVDPTGALSALDGVRDVRHEDSLYTVFPADGCRDLYARVSELVRESGWSIESVYQESGRLDEVFRELTEGRAA